jgi:LuxR family maltose regulon positive regulatory protein
MRGHQDISGFIQAFAGDHRYIVDYLVEEVLDRQPKPVRNFLLQTAILDRLTGSLCDAVTRQEDGGVRLEALERGNFFIVPLDDQRHWYRYHHLFADVLYAHLLAEQPDQVAALHQRASAWFEQNALPSDAIRHALAAEDFEHAASLIERAVPAMTRNRQEDMLLVWLQALPEEVFHDRPVLSVRYAGTLLQTGQLDGVEARLHDAERWLETPTNLGERTETPSAERGIEDEADIHELPGWIAVYRAGIAIALGDMASTIQYAQRVLDLAPEDDHHRRGAAASILGLVFWASGDLEAGYRSYTEGMAHLLSAGNISDVVGGSISAADMRITQGRLREAMRIYEGGLQLANDHGEPAMRGTADMYVGMSELYRERNDLQAATQYMLRSQTQGEHTGFPQYRYRWRVAMARIRQAEGDLDGALDLLHEAERWYVSDFLPNVRPIAALKVQIWIAQGRLGEALEWVREQGLSVEDDLSYLREFEHITLARVLLVRSRIDQSDPAILGLMGFLDRLLQTAEARGGSGSVIEILILQALVHQTHGDIPTALVPLARALILAEPEGYDRLFVDEGAPMALLLETAAKHGITPTYVRQLLNAFGEAEDRLPVNQGLLDPLSERELDVLRLLATDLSGPEIARQLSVSLSTLRTHTQNIYSKLGVNSRRTAVRRAEELGLL